MPNDHVVLDNRMGANTDIIANAVLLADHHPVTSSKLIPDQIAGIDHGVRSDDASLPNCRRKLSALLPSRRLPNHAKVSHLHAIAQVHIGKDLAGATTLFIHLPSPIMECRRSIPSMPPGAAPSPQRIVISPSLKESSPDTRGSRAPLWGSYHPICTQ